MPPRTDYRTRPTHILATITACKGTITFHRSTIYIRVHIDVHAIVYALEWCVAVIAAWELRVKIL
jgi:hypothetical protein